MVKSISMDEVWSWQFGIALVCFMAPTVIAARMVYRRIVASELCRSRGAQKAVGRIVQPVPQPPAREVSPAPAEPAPAPVRIGSIYQPIENLRQRLLEFRASLERTSTALGHLQECDWQVSGDLNRASQIMHQAFAEKAPLPDGVPIGPGSVKNVSSAA